MLHIGCSHPPNHHDDNLIHLIHLTGTIAFHLINWNLIIYNTLTYTETGNTNKGKLLSILPKILGYHNPMQRHLIPFLAIAQPTTTTSSNQPTRSPTPPNIRDRQAAIVFRPQHRIQLDLLLCDAYTSLVVR